MAKEITQSESRSERRRRMVAEMSNIRTLKWVGVALAVHMVLILGTSYGYMRDKGLFRWVGLQPVPVVKPTEDASTLKEPVEEPKPAVRNIEYSAPDDPSSGSSPAITATPENGAVDEAAEAEQQKPVVKSDFEKTGRNDPCPCGSGKKFKQCHGAA